MYRHVSRSGAIKKRKRIDELHHAWLEAADKFDEDKRCALVERRERLEADREAELQETGLQLQETKRQLQETKLQLQEAKRQLQEMRLQEMNERLLRTGQQVNEDDRELQELGRALQAGRCLRGERCEVESSDGEWCEARAEAEMIAASNARCHGVNGQAAA